MPLTRLALLTCIHRHFPAALDGVRGFPKWKRVESRRLKTTQGHGDLCALWKGSTYPQSSHQKARRSRPRGQGPAHKSQGSAKNSSSTKKNIGASALLHAAAPGLGDGNEGRCVRGHEWVSSTVPIRLQQAFFGEGVPGARAHACSPLREWSCRKKRRAGLPLLRAAPEEAVGEEA